MELLLEKGANVRARDDNGNTALHEASQGGHSAIVSLLLEKSVDVNEQTKSGEGGGWGPQVGFVVVEWLREA